MNTRRARLITAASLAVVALAPVPRAVSADAPNSSARFTATSAGYTVTVPRSADAPGYTVSITADPLRLTTSRGGHVVLDTTAAAPSAPGPFTFHTAAGSQSATSVQSAQWQDGALLVSLATPDRADTVSVQITPHADRYRIQSTVTGTNAADSSGMNYVMSSAGHWYGQGEASTPDGGPYTR